MRATVFISVISQGSTMSTRCVCDGGNPHTHTPPTHTHPYTLVPCWHGRDCLKLVFTSEKHSEWICASVYGSPPALCMAFSSVASFGRKCWRGFCKDPKLRLRCWLSLATLLVTTGRRLWPKQFSHSQPKLLTAATMFAPLSILMHNSFASLSNHSTSTFFQALGKTAVWLSGINAVWGQWDLSKQSEMQWTMMLTNGITSTLDHLHS